MNLQKIIAGVKGSENGIYRTASLRSMLLACATSGGKTVFMMLMSYAGYMANEGYGILVMLTGIIMTVKTIFDGVCDPIVAACFDRLKVGKRLGKVRKFLLIGYGVTVVSAILMFRILVNRFTGVVGVVMYCLHFALYIIGYTILSIGTTTIPAILTNDPKQRPFMNFAATVYQFSAPIILNALMAFLILPRHNNQYDAACLGEACFVYSGVALLFMTLSIIGIAPVDNEENLGQLMSMGKNKQIGFKDMWDMIKVNKPLRCYIITGTSDKLATKMSTDSIVNVMLTGILIANYQAVTIINSFSKVVALVFAFLGGVFIAKYGVKKSTTTWSWVNIGISTALFALCMYLGPWGMREIGVGGVAMFAYVALAMGKDAAAMVLNTAEGMMRADIVDYELERSGNFMPGMVGACYTFTEKLISSLGSTFTTMAVALIGYQTVMPQMGDKVTVSLFYLTMLLVYGMPILGWLCNIIAMKFYSLDKERMVEIQKNISERKAAFRSKK